MGSPVVYAPFYNHTSIDILVCPQAASDWGHYGLRLGPARDVAHRGHPRSLRVPYELTILSAHRTPDRLVEYARSAEARASG